MATTEREIKPLPKVIEDLPPAKLAFFCRKCKEVVAATQTKKKFHFCCPKCKRQDIAFGTVESIRNHYRLKE